MPINFGAAGWGPRNFIISNTDQEYITYLDDDNWYEPDHLKCLFNAIKRSNSDMAYTGTNLFDKNNNLISTRMHPYAPTAGNIDTSEIMHKRSLINRCGGWRFVEKCNDWDIVSRWMPELEWSHTNKITLNFYLRENCGIHRL
jgi:glycosyltransferase involved in cell wall biosynthesis